MKCFVIYDETGRIYAAEYGEKPTLPTELNFIQTEIEDGSQITSVDVSDRENPKLLYNAPKESALEKELTEIKESNDKLKAQIAYLSMMSGFDVEEV
ncbi:hypothetical protein [Lacrimispora sp.]|uniref:hypothetical protein n=1 Tax=Lacrimispora sp. TaxID=2719234 RepID=UPI0028AC03A6|nr:hypothetical protein [Lacrimispora sp.]